MKFKKIPTNLEIYNEMVKDYGMDPLCAKVVSFLNQSSQQVPMDEIKLALSDQTQIESFDLSFLDDVVQFLKEAKDTRQKIIVCGDYDCDGICATSIIVGSLRQYGLECGFYIPNRFTEGYGISPNTIQMAYDRGYQIVLSVDTGVKETKALRLAKALGMKVILSDHHVYEQEDLVYDYFLHPQVFPDYFEDMCGAGIAYLLSLRLVGFNEAYTMLAATATIGDFVNIRKANRQIVKKGIELYNHNVFLQLIALQSDNKEFDETKIAFQIVPKINCLGRLADRANANRMVDYFLLDENLFEEKMQILDFRDKIIALNEERKALSDQCLKLAKQKCRHAHKDFIILYDQGFHEGLNGIIAGKLKEDYQCPAMVLTEDGDLLKGSIRSIQSVDLSHFFDGILDQLLNYGGHAEAAGIAFHKEALPLVESYVHEKMQGIEITNELEVMPVTKKFLSIKSIEALK